MLNPQIAHERLETFADKKHDERRRERIAALPPELRGPAYSFLDRDENGKSFPHSTDYAERRRRERAASEKMDAMTPAQREQIFAAFFPHLAPILEARWSAAHAPYQSGYSRKAFRVYHRPDWTREARRNFVERLITCLGEYDAQEMAWFAVWCPCMSWYADMVGSLCAVAIDKGGPEGEAVFQILLASGRGEHEIGAMGRHVTRGLLSASRPEGWAFVERLLIAAQRQEGLRQTILETVDEAHTEAFRRMLRLIVEHELCRFSSVIRAADVWFGFGWEAPSLKEANAAINQVITFLDDPAARDAAITASDSGETVYLALWTIAFDDAAAAIESARPLLTDKLLARRAAAVHLLTQLGLPEAQATLLPVLDDEDKRISAMAFGAVNFHEPGIGATDLFERLERNLPRFPKEATEAEPILFPWLKPSLGGEAIANVLPNALGERDPMRLLPYTNIMGPYSRANVADKFADKKQPRTAEVRDVLIGFLGDSSSDVRAKAFAGLEHFPLEDAAITAEYERLLTRKAADLRRDLIKLLLKQDDAAALESAGRLLASKTENQRVAGLDLLAQMGAKGRSPAKVRPLAASYRAARPTPSEAETALLDSLMDEKRETPTLDNALGLMNPADLTPVVAPKIPGAQSASLLTKALSAVGLTDAPGPKLTSDAARAIIVALDQFIEENREKPVRLRGEEDATETLVGNVRWGFALPDYTLPLVEDLARFVLADELRTWRQSRPASLTADPLDLLRAAAALRAHTSDYWGSAHNALRGKSAAFFARLYTDLDGLALKHPGAVPSLVDWLMRLNPPAESATDFMLDAVETAFFLIAEEVGRKPDANESDKRFPSEDAPEEKKWKAAWRGNERYLAWLTALHQHFQWFPTLWSAAQIKRFWNLLCYLDRPDSGTRRFRPRQREILLAAYRIGAAPSADVYDALLGPRPGGSGYLGYYDHSFDMLKSLSGRKSDPQFETVPHLKEIVENCRRRILEVELTRGDTTTAATIPARSLRCAGGTEIFLKLLRAMGKEPFQRGYSYGGDENRSAIFSYLIRATFPNADRQTDETPEIFAAQVAAAKIPEKRLIEAAMYAPQWARRVEFALNWPAFAEGVWWLHAHTRDNQWSVAAEIREAWAGEISDKTPLTAEDLLEGAVDVAWFHRIYAALGAERWKMLDEAAKYASSSGGHKRAQLFADAMLGNADRAELLTRIKEKRNQDALRALGLLPLPTDAEERENETLARYAAMQEFLRGSRQFGAQRQESEKKATRIGMENLARTSGYPDPIRLEWAMEARAVADLAAGPLTATAGDVTVTLSINPLGEPDLQVTRNNRVLQNLPPAAKKDPAIAELTTRRRELQRQAARMRRSLEEAMNRGDVFTGTELQKLYEHPILQPMLRSLAFVEDVDSSERRLGYPVENGGALEDFAGNAAPLSPDARLRLAHPYDLLKDGNWDKWQRDVFLRERVQPFKQIFRELYVLTDAERKDETRSERYAGHQVNPKQALALLGGRGWVSLPEEGVRRTFHAEGLTAWLEFTGLTFSPLDVEGLTIENVRFTRRGEGRSLPLSEIPPRVFSETMRDLDLVVSVAHQGGVDPEASASTVEMRESLVREASRLLQLDNVGFEKSHVLIEGKLAAYSVHLGSAVVHRQPGGFVCIVPVHSQHRGRLFLPFADDDPRTAEVVSKVLLLARDTEIKDPTILEQLLSVR